MDEQTAGFLGNVLIAVAGVGGTYLGVWMTQRHERGLRAADSRSVAARDLGDRYAEWAGKTQAMVWHFGRNWRAGNCLDDATNAAEINRVASMEEAFGSARAELLTARAALLFAEPNEEWRNRIKVISRCAIEASWDDSLGNEPAPDDLKYVLPKALSKAVDDLLAGLVQTHALLRLSPESR